MWMRLFIALIVVIAVTVGVLVLALSSNREQLVKLIVFRDFFDVSLPILAFGALIKYLCSGCIHCKSKDLGRWQNGRYDKAIFC